MTSKTQKNLTEEEWQKKLPKEVYQVMREGATEAPFTGEYLNNKESGDYLCRGCGAELFSSDTKFDSGTGWPSFTLPMNKEKVVLAEDNSYGMRRIEVSCANCGGHLGHVFPDGPKEGESRYCINSCALDFQKK